MVIAGQKLREASYRGVSFYVNEATMSAGRRVVLHEYPQRDKPYVEDLGRATRKITERCFVCGEDYIEQTQKILEVLEKPGSGTLIHPWLGQMTVTPTEVSTVSYVNGQERYATFSLTFVEAGELSYPTAAQDTASQLKSMADEIQKGVIESFLDKISLEPFTTYIDAALSGDLLDVLGVISNSELAAVFDFSNKVADLVGSGLALLHTNPLVFATQLANALGLSGLATTAARWSAVGKQVKNLFEKDELSRGTRSYYNYETETGQAEVWSDSVVQTTRNRAAIETLSRQLIIAQAVGAASLIGTELDRPFETATAADAAVALDDVEQACTALMEILEDEILRETNDEVYQSLCRARTAVFEHLTQLMTDLNRLMQIHLNDVAPALVLAYDYYGDAARESEIVARNKVANGGFCPTELRILTQ